MRHFRKCICHARRRRYQPVGSRTCCFDESLVQLKVNQDTSFHSYAWKRELNGLSTIFAMRSGSHCDLICMAILFLRCVWAWPTLPILNFKHNHTSLASLNATELGNPYQCYEPHLRKDRRAKTIDCLRAAAFLPNLHEPGIFHRGDYFEDPFSLPHTVIFKTCRIKFDLRFGRQDVSSWIALNLALRKILDACQFTIGGERTGGQTTAGNAGMIILTAENVNWPETNAASLNSAERLR